ncbi:MAG: hypothetical protein JNG85_14700 [Spirochaetaceae bacterium]|nr:hypothetical protein [Spirochaetaceae bacterium]
MIQGDLFGAPNVTEDARELRTTARATYHETTNPDEHGCADCLRADWKAERCRLAGRPVDIDYGTCECWKSKE